MPINSAACHHLILPDVARNNTSFNFIPPSAAVLGEISMLVCMDPSSPPVKRTLHLLKTPDILLANDSGQSGSYLSGNTIAAPVLSKIADICLIREMFEGADPRLL